MHFTQPIPPPTFPNSNDHISRLESRLKRIQERNTKKDVKAKEIIASMNEFREIFMRDTLKSGNNVIIPNDPSNNETIYENIDKSFLERKILPEHAINSEEKLVLVENDWLTKDEPDMKEEKIDQVSTE